MRIPIHIRGAVALLENIQARRSVQHVAHFSSADKENHAYSGILRVLVGCYLGVCYRYRSIYIHTHVMQINHNFINTPCHNIRTSVHATWKTI